MGEEVEEEDCNLIAKLRDLGAIIIGVTNMHELGLGTTGINPNRYKLLLLFTMSYVLDNAIVQYTLNVCSRGK